MHIELFRSWCLECPEVEIDHSAQGEKFRVKKKLFAIIANNQISIKCSPEHYHQIRQSVSLVLNQQKDYPDIIGLPLLMPHNFHLKCCMSI